MRVRRLEQIRVRVFGAEHLRNLTSVVEKARVFFLGGGGKGLFVAGGKTTFERDLDHSYQKKAGYHWIRRAYETKT